MNPLKLLVLTTAFAASTAPVASAPFSRGNAEAPSYAQPAENIVIILADIHRHINDDVYRFPYPLDVTGQNVFRAAAVRLDYYKDMYPGKMTDVVALAKAQVYEKLTSYQEAGENYNAAEASKDENIRRLAGEGFERTKKFAAAVNQPLDKSGLRTYERDLQKKIKDLDALAGEYRDTPERKNPYKSLALVERERAQLQLAEFYKMMRFMQPFSTNDAILQIKRNIDQNKDSKLLFTHHMMLADMYYDLANEYTLLQDPEGPGFSLKEFGGFASLARAEYHIIEQADGYPEKMEARAKLLALEAFVERITDKAK